MSRGRGSLNRKVNTRDTGARFEAAAERYLCTQGMVLITRNFSCRMGEIDRVMQHGPTLVFVEVRFRTPHALVSPIASVTPAKQRRLIKTAQFYLQRQPRFATMPCRFDVIGVTGNPDAPEFNWIRNAFSA